MDNWQQNWQNSEENENRICKHEQNNLHNLRAYDTHLVNSACKPDQI